MQIEQFRSVLEAMQTLKAEVRKEEGREGGRGGEGGKELCKRNMKRWNIKLKGEGGEGGGRRPPETRRGSDISTSLALSLSLQEVKKMIHADMTRIGRESGLHSFEQVYTCTCMYIHVRVCIYRRHNKLVG